MHYHPGHDQGSDYCADVCSGIEYSRGKRSFFFGEPFRHGFDAGWKNGGFAEAQGIAREHKTAERVCECRAHGSEAPENHGEGVAQAGADRKSTRLNSSHPSISYAVFCLKKKNNSTLISTQLGT